MKVVNNFNTLSLYFNKLETKDDFYYVQVIQRKKDGHEKSERNIKNFYFYNKVDFLNAQDYIISLCHQYNARAYFWINPRNARKVAFECIKSYTDLIAQDDCHAGHKVWDKKCGGNPAPGYEHRWIVDVDNKNKDYMTKIYELINTCRGHEDNKITDIIPTLNGYHLITVGFDLHYFKQLLIMNHLDDVDVHKDNPTLLYYAKDVGENM